MADNLILQSATLASIPSGTVIATRSVTYSGDAGAHVAPTPLLTLSGADDAKVATDVPLPTALGAQGGIKVDAYIVGDTGTPSTLDTDNDAIVTLNSKSIAVGTATAVPKFFKIDRATNADGAAVVNLVASKKIRVLTFHLVCAASVGVKWQSSTSNATGTGSNTDLTGLETYGANGGIAAPFCPVGLFETVAGEALKLNLNGAFQVSGSGTYIEV